MLFFSSRHAAVNPTSVFFATGVMSAFDFFRFSVPAIMYANNIHRVYGVCTYMHEAYIDCVYQMFFSSTRYTRYSVCTAARILSTSPTRYQVYSWEERPPISGGGLLVAARLFIMLCHSTRWSGWCFAAHLTRWNMGAFSCFVTHDGGFGAKSFFLVPSFLTRCFVR